MATKICIKRIYDPPADDDGLRALVDRLWPRGVSKSQARIDVWAKPLAPSTELRKWFHAAEGRQAEFARRYLAELDPHRADAARLLESAKDNGLTLLTASKEPQHSHAAILARFLASRPE